MILPEMPFTRLQGVYARYLLGNASAESSHAFAKVVKPLAERGLELSKR